MINDKVKNLKTTNASVRNLVGVFSDMAAKVHNFCNVWVGLFFHRFRIIKLYTKN